MRKVIVIGIVLAAAIAAASVLLIRRDHPQTDLEAATAAYDRHEYAAARALLQPLADQGVAEAQYRLGKLYEYGRGVARDYDEAAIWYRTAANQEHGWATYRVAVLMNYGYVKLPEMTQDQRDAEVARWYRRAALAGVAPARADYAYVLLIGRGVPEDAVESVKWARLAAIQGDPDGEYMLGNALREGNGVARDDAEAAQWYLKSVVQRIGGATQMSVRRRLLEMWRDRTGPWPDADAFVDWLAKLANLGDIGAQLELAEMYEEGETVPQNLEQSTKWYVMAAGGNTQYTADRWAHISANALALRKVAEFYLAGERLPKDPQAALVLLTRAVERNDIRSELLLGNLYMDGDTIARDDRQAYVWLDLAARRKNAASFEHEFWVEARRRRDELIMRMTAADLEAAQADAAKWRCRNQFCTRTE